MTPIPTKPNQRSSDLLNAMSGDPLSFVLHALEFVPDMILYPLIQRFKIHNSVLMVLRVVIWLLILAFGVLLGYYQTLSLNTILDADNL
jgi:hypothetical protein